MGNHVVRLYALALAILVFFLAWAAIAARPWEAEASAGAAPPDPRSTELAAQERRVERKARRLERLLASREEASVPTRVVASEQAAATPVAVRVVEAPPTTRSRSS